MSPIELLVLAHLEFAIRPVCTFAYPQGTISEAFTDLQCMPGDVLTDQRRIGFIFPGPDGQARYIELPCRRLRTI